ncbi:MAG: M50 family metallopeptidase [Alphaproteobacteria bacterium]|nr:M50 family metallopeptidase [Alphaproteobacteria bacterium]
MANFLDKIINLFKWPIAIYMLISLPALFSSVDFFSFTSFKYVALGAGFFMYFIARTMADSSVKTAMQIVAHELTHSFFALITFHKVKHIRLDPEGSGGEMGFAGEGNWLIVIAPYFFPLFGFFYMLIMPYFPESIMFNGILGYILGYHMDTVGSQIHDKQTDLPKVSYKFCWMFLPGANFWTIGSIIAYNSKGWLGVKVYFDLINRLNLQNFEYLINLVF